MFDQNTIDRLNQRNIEEKRILTKNSHFGQHEDHDYESNHKKKVTIKAQEKIVSINNNLRYKSF